MIQNSFLIFVCKKGLVYPNVNSSYILPSQLQLVFARTLNKLDKIILARYLIDLHTIKLVRDLHFRIWIMYLGWWYEIIV